MSSIIAEGYSAFETEKAPTGVVKYLETPNEVLALIRSGKLKDHILLVRGGTTTFLAPALSMGAIGVITMSGAPESHLGILSREFQTPCVMTVAPDRQRVRATSPARPTTRTSRRSSQGARRQDASGSTARTTTSAASS